MHIYIYSFSDLKYVSFLFLLYFLLIFDFELI